MYSTSFQVGASFITFNNSSMSRWLVTVDFYGIPQVHSSMASRGHIVSQEGVTHFSKQLMDSIGLPGLFIAVLLGDGLCQPQGKERWSKALLIDDYLRAYCILCAFIYIYILEFPKPTPQVRLNLQSAKTPCLVLPEPQMSIEETDGYLKS